jgi:ABC-2 type transport system permease protein
MSTYSDDFKQGTIELLMTSPATDLQIVLGKYWECMTIFVAMLIPTILPFAYTFAHIDGPAPWLLLLCGYLGVALLGSSLVVLGGLFSSLTSTRIIAVILTFGVILILWMSERWLTGDLRGMAAFLQYCSTFQHYDRFTRGVIDTSDGLFYITFLFFGLFATVRSLESMRWRRA